MENVPHPLRVWRKANNVTLAALAGKLGVGPSHLSQVERGLGGLSLTMAAKIERETGITASELVNSTKPRAA